jgi:hypothetical protein
MPDSLFVPVVRLPLDGEDDVPLLLTADPNSSVPELSRSWNMAMLRAEPLDMFAVTVNDPEFFAIHHACCMVSVMSAWVTLEPAIKNHVLPSESVTLLRFAAVFQCTSASSKSPAVAVKVTDPLGIEDGGTYCTSERDI